MSRRAPATYFKPGDWNAVCDYCGHYFKASQLRQDWRGLMACARDWEPRHPQDFVHGVVDNMTPPWTRVPMPPNFVTVGSAPPVPPPIGGGGGGTSAIAGIAIAGLAIAGTGGTPTISTTAVAGRAVAGRAIAGTF